MHRRGRALLKLARVLGVSQAPPDAAQGAAAGAGEEAGDGAAPAEQQVPASGQGVRVVADIAGPLLQQFIMSGEPLWGGGGGH